MGPAGPTRGSNQPKCPRSESAAARIEWSRPGPTRFESELANGAKPGRPRVRIRVGGESSGPTLDRRCAQATVLDRRAPWRWCRPPLLRARIRCRTASAASSGGRPPAGAAARLLCSGLLADFGVIGGGGGGGRLCYPSPLGYSPPRRVLLPRTTRARDSTTYCFAGLRAATTHP